MKNIILTLIAVVFLILSLGFVTAIDMELKKVNDNSTAGDIDVNDAVLAGYGLSISGYASSHPIFGGSSSGISGNDSPLYGVSNPGSLFGGSGLGSGGNQNFY
ncbi:hypothetical protein [Methanobrevibacter millerae]|uniref:Uncharacterized protein n=1 Tax=Methanobrevibacter millerae TaxID=230361 RepID=A0A1G5VBR7_9EURY|nr:hypothetical protein [Methanobrevibacter millerae]SDA43244.1 hypothetical protein SAMN02910315_00514 [Methanobrevibacter millerae]